MAVKILKPNNCDVLIGDGNSGAKSMQLRHYKPLIEKIEGLSYVPHTAITPSVYRGYLQQIGATHENPETGNAIEQADFGKDVLEAHMELRNSLKPGTYYAFRSDECHPGGNGLWKGEFIRLAGNVDDDLKIINNAAKIVLKSEFSEDVLAFKRRAGLANEETPGIFTMEMVATDVWRQVSPMAGWRGPACEQILVPIAHFNAISAYDGNKNVALIAGGAGIGGANTPWFTGVFTRQQDGSIQQAGNMKLIEMKIRVLYGGKLTWLRSAAGIVDSQNGWNSEAIIGARDVSKAVMARLEGEFYNAADALAAFANETKETVYVELTLKPDGNLAVLQCAPAKPYCKITKPDIPQDRKIMDVTKQEFFGQKVCGNALIDTEQAIYLPRNGDLNILAKYNAETKNYVLITDLLHSSFMAFSLADYSNAAGIVFTTQTVCSNNDAQMTLNSHINGALREAGIFVLEGTASDEFIGKLTPGINNVKLTSYVDELAGEAFVAER